MPKLTLGTGSFFVTKNRTDTPDFRGLMTIAHGNIEKVQHCIEIPLSVGGSTMCWFKKNFREDQEPVLSKESDGVLVFPGLNGHLYPAWGDEPQASIAGLRHDHTPGNVLQAFRECIIFEICNALKPLKMKSLRVDGGLSNDRELMQMLSDCLEATILLERGITEMTAYGAALLGSGLKPEECDVDEVHPRENKKLDVIYEEWSAKKKKLHEQKI